MFAFIEMLPTLSVLYLALPLVVIFLLLTGRVGRPRRFNEVTRSEVQDPDDEGVSDKEFEKYRRKVARQHKI